MKNPSGERADKEEKKASDYLNTLSIEDWEKIASEFNKKKEKKDEE